MNFTPDMEISNADSLTAYAAGDYNAGSGNSPALFSRYRLGQKGITRDGRVFRFGRVGAVAAVAGSIYQSAAPVPNHLAQTPAAAAIGATAVTISTLGATAATQNQYAEGLLQVDTTPGNGIAYGINNHLANAGSAILVVNLEKDDAIQVALTTSSRVGLFSNPYADVIVVPTTKTANVIGVPLVAAAIGAYCWFQTWGLCPVLINGTPAVTAPVVNSATTAGAADVWTAAAQPTAQYLGDMAQVGVSTKNNMVFLKIAA